MVMVICSIRDMKTEMFSRPFFVMKEAQAVRSFTDEVNRPAEDNGMFNHPEDYSLYAIGIFDDQEGKIVGYDLPKLLIHAHQVKNDTEKTNFNRPLHAV